MQVLHVVKKIKKTNSFLFFLLFFFSLNFGEEEEEEEKVKKRAVPSSLKSACLNIYRECESADQEWQLLRGQVQ